MSRNRVSDQLLLQTLLLNPGATDEEIGKKLSLSRVQVSRRKNKPEFRALLQKDYADVLRLFRDYKGRAARRVLELIESKDERVALRAASYLLDNALAANTPEREGHEQTWEALSVRVLAELNSCSDEN